MENQIESFNAARRLDHIIKVLADNGIRWEARTVYHLLAPTYIEVGGFTVDLPDLEDGALTTEKLAVALTEGYDRVMRYREDQRRNPPKLHKPEVTRDGKK